MSTGDRIPNDAIGCKGSIYYIGCTESLRVKIGFTKSGVAKRLSALQTGNPARLEIVASHPGSMRTEKYLHALFAEARVCGEWFAPSDSLLLHVALAGLHEIDRLQKEGSPLPAWSRKLMDNFL